jgi:hypothetical protein
MNPVRLGDVQYERAEVRDQKSEIRGQRSKTQVILAAAAGSVEFDRALSDY